MSFLTHRRFPFVCCIAASIALSFLAAPLHGQANWPAFRNDGSGIVSVKGAPTRWSPESVAWRSEVPGYGQSAPVVWNGTIYVTSSEGPWQEQGFVHAFDLETGKKRWTREVRATTRVKNYFRNSRAAPTCVVDENAVVSFFPGGDVTAMDHTGRTIWSVPLFDKYGQVDNDRGTASSLAHNRELVFVVVDHYGPSYAVALRKSDGSVAWKADRGERIPSWSSPVIARKGDRELVIISSSDTVDGYDASSGEVLWSVRDLYGNHIPSAGVAGNSIFVGSTDLAHGGGTDQARVGGSNSRIELTEEQGKPGFEFRWRTKRANSHYATPLAFADYVYYVDKLGILTAHNMETGELVFRQRIGGPCWASAIGVETESGESLVYFFMKNGSTLILKPGDEFQPVATNQLWDLQQMLAAARAAKKTREANRVPAHQEPPATGPEKMLADLPEEQLHRMFSYGDPTVYAAAIVDGHLIVRTGQHLYCVKGY